MSNRQTIINALTKATVATAEELADETRWPERKVRDTLSDLKKLGQITAERDDVTGKAAYRLADPKADRPAATVKQSLTVEVSKPVARESRVTESKIDSLAEDIKTAQREIDAEVRLDSAGRTIIDFCEWLAGKAKVRCPMNLYECKTVVTEAMAGIAQYPDMEAIARDQDKEIKLLKPALDEACETIKALDTDKTNALQSLYALTEETDRLRAENRALKILNESMPGFGAAHAGLTKGPFVVRIPGKPAVFANKYDNAKAAAMSAARQKQGGEVFALIPVGKAVRGAEWKTQ